MGVLRTWLCACVILSIPTLLPAQAPPLDPEFQANTYTTGYQQAPAVAVGPAGNFVVVWHSVGQYALSGQDGSKFGIFGQLYDPLGHRVGGEFQVNSYTTGTQRDPSVGMDGSGRFVVVWASDGQDGSGYGIFGQRYDTAGAKSGPEFRLNADTPGSQNHPRIAVNADGTFVAVWDQSDISGQGVTGQRFNALGVRIGPDFQVNTFTGDSQYRPAIASDRAGNFVVVWQSKYQDGSAQGVFGQRFDKTAAKTGPEFPVNTSTAGHQALPAVGVDPRGSFVVTWQSEPTFGVGRRGIFAQRFNSGSEKVGSEMAVMESHTSLTAETPAVGISERGDFVVAWHGYAGDGTVAPRGIWAQRYDRSGLADLFVFQVNTFTGGQVEPALASGPAGDLIVAWTGFNQDGDFSGIFGRHSSLSPRAMQVDAHDVGTGSDLNGVLEPGETVGVEPSWAILTGTPSTQVALGGTIYDISGPAFQSFNAADATADYGQTPPLDTGNCYDATHSHNCYRIGVASPDHGQVRHWDATVTELLSTGGYKNWKLHVGDSFSDVPRSQPFYRKIETLLHTGITSGCTATAYCPGNPVSRGQMAVFVAKGIVRLGENVPTAGSIGGQPYNCSPGGASIFADVSPTDFFCRHAHFLGAQNVTLGCGPTAFCPNETVTRDAMASFIAKAIVAPAGGAGVPQTYGPDPGTGRSYSCNGGSPNLHFSDVPVVNAFCRHIHFLWAKGVVDGCSATQYCPGQSVNRDAMAKFIGNGFGLLLYGP